MALATTTSRVAIGLQGTVSRILVVQILLPCLLGGPNSGGFMFLRRNQWVNLKVEIPSYGVTDWAKTFLVDFHSASKDPTSTPVISHPILNDSGLLVWKRPPPECFKLNTDASTDYSNNRVSFGPIIHNDLGRVMATSTCRFNAGIAVDTAEAMTILEGNSQMALGLLVCRILNHYFSNHILSFSFSPRASNAAANALSKVAFSRRKGCVEGRDS
ncbi:hypothetical protein ACOSP7_028653 [Xanthoceras sorbifolium]